MENKELLHIIDNYLLNRMSDSERQSFEAQLKTDSELKKLLMEQKQLKGAVESYAAQTIRQEIIMAGNTYFDNQTAPPSSASIPKWVWILLLVLAGLLAAYLLWPTEKPQGNSQQLYAAYYQAYRPIGFSVRDNGANPQAAFQSYLQAYQSGNYESTLNYFESLTDSLKKLAPIQLMQSVSLMETGDFAKAENSLKELLNTHPNFGDGNYFYALALLKNGNIQGAKQALQKVLMDGDSIYQKQAQQLLKELN